MICSLKIIYNDPIQGVQLDGADDGSRRWNWSGKYRYFNDNISHQKFI